MEQALPIMPAISVAAGAGISQSTSTISSRTIRQDFMLMTAPAVVNLPFIKRGAEGVGRRRGANAGVPWPVTDGAIHTGANGVMKGGAGP